MRRVLRSTSGTPARPSTCASRLLTAALLTPSSRAAALRLLLPASVTRKPSSAGWMPVGPWPSRAPPIVHFRLTMLSL